MIKIKHFITTAIIGGLVVILPIAILLKLFIWLFQWVTQLIAPVTGLVIAATQANDVLAQLLSIALILTSCFFLGVLVKTSWGKWAYESIEYWFLTRLPGYKMLKDLFTKLQPQSEQKFSKPVLVHFDQGEQEFLGFVTEEYGDDRFAVFIPTSPSPMNGFVVQTDASKIRFVNVSAESMMKTVIACGVGSADLIEKTEGAVGKK